MGKHIRTNIPEILDALDEVVQEEFGKLDPKQKKAATWFHFELYAARQLSKEEAHKAIPFLYGVILLEEEAQNPYAPYMRTLYEQFKESQT